MDLGSECGTSNQSSLSRICRNHCAYFSLSQSRGTTWNSKRMLIKFVSCEENTHSVASTSFFVESTIIVGVSCRTHRNLKDLHLKTFLDRIVVLIRNENVLNKFIEKKFYVSVSAELIATLFCFSTSFYFSGCRKLKTSKFLEAFNGRFIEVCFYTKIDCKLT